MPCCSGKFWDALSRTVRVQGNFLLVLDGLLLSPSYFSSVLCCCCFLTAFLLEETRAKSRAYHSCLWEW